ncbi:uncharacterized protein BDR25DRAFT_321757 [Lindgomyces ingoldianus]|uniref:Uncharacterized protein n=1 Tax=Lindgomyces ingoldianus TaxID=673940 RepID=A0ACB6RD23_9PLEO|nr:uncharacterized protein BDR25DRAFT_321757 [Lindgomyces ingoldianus]KAF2476227.1 hypothetical protein BDR25DRAFT_321757 [Lindgomyces ingoldianus]
MRIRLNISYVGLRYHLIRRPRPHTHRSILTLAIETSCDDTSVAVLEKKTSLNGHRTSAVLHFHKKVTSDNTTYHGVHPLVSLQSHQQNLAGLVDEAIHHLPPVECKDELLCKGRLVTCPGCGNSGRIVTFPDGGNSGRIWTRRRPDFISVTRGPGMRSNLFTGLDTAKGLAAAWQIDLVGVHHMQAHALTPRLVAALQNAYRPEDLAVHEKSGGGSPAIAIPIQPEFPFLSVLASGGHTLLIHSASLADHRVLAGTSDIAVGECLDKVARAVLPPQILQNATTTMYGALLEDFAFSQKLAGHHDSATPEPEIASQKLEIEDKYRLEMMTAGEYHAIYRTRRDYGYAVPKNQEEAQKQSTTKYGWGFNQPLSKAAGGLKSKSLEFSFSGLMTAVERVVRFRVDPLTGKLGKVERSSEDTTMEERKAMAREVMRAAFEHLASRVVLGLQQASLENPGPDRIETVVVSGGVAANQFLRLILASMLTAHGYAGVRLAFPPPSLCTDNAAMIAWTGIEMYAAGHSSPYTIRSIRKWPLDQLLSPHEDA